MEVLLDVNARAAYDKLLRAKEAAKLRHKDLDDKRKKFKEDLEERERQYHAGKAKEKSEQEKLREEIERLRKEGAALVQEHITKLQEDLLQDILNDTIPEDGSMYRIKVEWKADKDDEKNGGYDEPTLRRIFYKHGDISALVLSKKKGQALIEYERKEAAVSK